MEDRSSRGGRPTLGVASASHASIQVIVWILCIVVSGSVPEANANQARGQTIPGVEDPLLRDAKQAVRLRHFEKAVRLWGRAARRGNPEAQYRLGVAYRSGRGVERNLDRAAYWFEKGARNGDSNAQYALGVLYQNGRGVRQDRNEAIRLMGLAARGGHGEAKIVLEEIGRSDSVAFSTAEARVATNQRDPRGALAQAIRLGDTGVARESLARGAPLNGAPGDVKHWRPLILAIESNRPEMVQILIEQGANPNRKSRLGEPALVLAIRNKNRGMVRRLLEAGAVTTAKSTSGYMPLMEAARAGAAGIVEDLLASGAEASVVLEDHSSASDIARRFRHAKLARRLERAGAAADRRMGKGRLAALDASLKIGSGEEETVLPAFIEAARKGDAGLLRELLDRHLDPRVRDAEGETALHRAAQGGHVEAVRILLEAGLDANLRGRDQATPLLRAMASTADDSEAVVAMLLGAGADPYLRDRLSAGVIDYAAEGASPGKLERIREAGGGWSQAEAGRALEAAAVAGRRRVVRALLEVVQGSKERNAALCGAIPSSDEEILDRLLEPPTTLDHDCAGGRTALMLAAYSGRRAIVRKFLAAGADPNRSVRSGDTALIAAASRGHAEIVSELVHAGAEVDHRGAHRMTALMAAAVSGRLEVVRILLDSSADRRMRGDSDLTALDLARAAGHDEVAALIESFRPGWRNWFGSSETASKS